MQETRNKYFAYSFTMGLCAILGEIAGGLIGHMGNNILLGVLLALYFTAIPAFGAVYGFVKATKLKKFKNKKDNVNLQLENELNIKYEELEKLEHLEHELYTQLCTELSKTPTDFTEKSAIHKTIIPNGTHLLDNNIAEL